ncbi:MAG: hypothetical protein AAGI45_16805 [Cyanobacteria bacterium P01_H01_bin.26]
MSQQHFLVKNLLEQLSSEERYTFSDSQIEALHKAALSLPKTSQAVRIRWSIPFPGKGFYIVLLAGKERRSRQRLLAEKEFKVLPIIMVIFTMIFGCAVIFGLFYAQRKLAISQQRSAVSLDEPEEEIHPTVVPFKYDREQCETSLREWKDDQCIDHEHNHTF